MEVIIEKNGAKKKKKVKKYIDSDATSEYSSDDCGSDGNMMANRREIVL
jgi:hypothetical protein